MRKSRPFLPVRVSASTSPAIGLWIETSDGAKFWLRAMNALKNCGVEDVLIAVVDRLKGFPDRSGCSIRDRIPSLG
jgi:putative transposase